MWKKIAKGLARAIQWLGEKATELGEWLQSLARSSQKRAMKADEELKKPSTGFFKGLWLMTKATAEDVVQLAIGIIVPLEGIIFVIPASLLTALLQGLIAQERASIFVRNQWAKLFAKSEKAEEVSLGEEA